MEVKTYTQESRGKNILRPSRGRIVGLWADVLVRVDLASHDHHPDEEYHTNDPEGEFSLPALADIPLLQKRQRIPTRPLRIAVEDVLIAQVVDIGAGKELYRSTDYACDEEHEQDKGEHHHGAWEQFPLRNVDDFDDDEEYGDGANGNAVGHYPWHSQAHPVLYLHELSVDA
jgi:hypothetical protein